MQAIREDLDNIDSRLRVSTKFDFVLQTIDKEFSLYYNFPKGDGEAFRAWILYYHPEALVLPLNLVVGPVRNLLLMVQVRFISIDDIM